jgi:mannose-6-phosphate isomerase class I
MIRTGELDWYCTADDPDQLALIPFADLCALFDELRTRPLRCRPVYLEGVWGGFYLKRLRNLPTEMRNCAWIFDMIPMEVSIAASWNGRELEVPFFTFVQQQAQKLLGRTAFDAFGGYFPVRFNYDDTFHSSGNMSIQCHPDAEYVTRVHGELGRQDESYYVCVAGENACTYLGFEKEGSCEAFFSAAEKAQETGELIDYRQYVHAVPSKPGTQVMIPAGTIHASGQNQVILEIGSLTVGSYTYKRYDYQRIDPQSGLPRPIHLKAGQKVIHGERTSEWVDQNLVNHGGVVRQGADWRETVVGEHDLLYFSLRSLIFHTEMTDDTNGCFHVLALTEGERVRIVSAADENRYFVAKYLDVIVVPADFGAYRLINEGEGPVTVHKTTLKQGFVHA